MTGNILMLSAGDIRYFSTLATIAATLLGLSFLSLSFFLTGLLKRYKNLASPVYRFEDDRELKCKLHYDFASSEEVTDRNLIDSDPLVIFIAFSASLSWNMYFTALILAITAISGQFAHPAVFAGELFLCFILQSYSFRVRRAQYRSRLRVYRTGEEIYWPILERLFLVCYGAAALSVSLFATMYILGNRPPGQWLWNAAMRTGLADYADLLYVGALKGVCAAAVLAGLYVINKDMFVVFKAKASDQMRGHWLRDFTSVRYPRLRNRVRIIMARRPSDELATTWNGGRPPDKFIRPAFILTAS
jgi:hypothetical protein